MKLTFSYLFLSESVDLEFQRSNTCHLKTLHLVCKYHKLCVRPPKASFRYAEHLSSRIQDVFRLKHRCFLVSFARFLITSFYKTRANSYFFFYNRHRFGKKVVSTTIYLQSQSKESFLTANEKTNTATRCG